MKNLGLGVLAGLSLALSACVTINGAPMGPADNSNGNNNNAVTQYPIETAMLNIYTKARSQKLAAVVNNQNIVADIKVIPKGATLFNGKQVQSAEFNTITRSDNQLIDQSVSINYFTLNPLVFHGYTDNSGEYSIATQTTTIPKLAKVGDSSQLITENVYSDSSKREQTGRYTQSWSLMQDSNNTALFCINTSANMLLSVDPNGTSAECYKINAQGDILSSKLTVSTPTGTIEFMGR